ncbi:unnamed protein product [Paramecium pentaurelia]|uniref:Transmembrane protein n=1 Tax=Paramecium pentaurelia TaxID=43138 RepID=A0A8S1V5Z5_9CILI|nr:unnamed protein product [Paramecium pentaurelia]
MFLSPINVSIELKVPKILTRSQLTASKTLQNAGYGMMISLSCSGFLMLLLGRFQQIISLLNILQQQSFFKYLDVEYPQHVQIYFESLNFITLQPLLNYLNFPDLYSNIFSKQFQESAGNFKEYQINVDFLSNIDYLVFQIFVECTFSLMLYIYEKIYFETHFFKKSFIVYLKTEMENYNISFYLSISIQKEELRNQKNYQQRSFYQIHLCKQLRLNVQSWQFFISNTKSEIRQRIFLLIFFVFLGNIIWIFLFNFKKHKVIKIKQVFQLQHEKLIYLNNSLFIFFQLNLNFTLYYKVYYQYHQLILLILF